MIKKHLIYIGFFTVIFLMSAQINAQTGTNTSERTRESVREKTVEQIKSFREEDRRGENKDEEEQKVKTRKEERTNATGTDRIIEKTRIKTLTVEERKAASGTIQKNECAEYRVKIITREEAKELKEKRRNEKEERCVKYSVEIGEASLEKFKEKIRSSEEKIEEKRIEMEKRITEKREEMEDKITKKHEELEERLLTIKEERKRKTVEKIDEHFEKLNKKLTDHYFNVLVKIEKILNKISKRADKAEAHGYDVSEVRSAIQSAKDAINGSREAIVAQAGKIYSIEIIGEDTLRNDVTETRKKLHNDLKNTRLTVKSAHDAVRKAAVALAQIPKVDELEIEDGDETESETPSPSPSVSPSPSPSASPSPTPSLTP